jgi:hypothetical protein
MPEYAQKVAKRTGGAAGARGWTRPTSHATVSAPGGTDGGPPGTLQALLNEAPTVQAVTQMKGALNRRGSSLQVAQSKAAFHDALVDVAQGRFETVPREQGVEEELLQGKFVAQREGIEDEEDLLQGKFEAAQRAAGSDYGAAPNETGMPDGLKAGIESWSGMDLSDVSVHSNSSTPAQINALAFAQGSDIHLAPGQERHLPHEAWHVVQQRQGRVAPTLQLAGVNINDDNGLEAEADRMGAQASQLKKDETPVGVAGHDVRCPHGLSMPEHAFSARRHDNPPANTARSASARAAMSADSPPGLTGLEMVHASLNRAPLVEHTAQLRCSLNQSPRVAQLAVLSGAMQRTAAAGPPIQRLELTDQMWTHIAKGELRDGKKLVGYHWTGDANAIAEKNGESKQGPDALGVYVEGIQTREQYGQAKKRAPIKKATASTFWPDAWTEAEIKNAIANGGTPRNNVSEVGVKATRADARGMSLYVNPDSVFPVIGETEEAETRGGRKKKGGRW